MINVARLTLFTLFASALSLSFTFPSQAREVKNSAKGDVCDTRPDLCGGAAPARKKKTRKPASKSFGDEIDGELSELDLDIQRRNNDSEPQARSRRPSSMPARTVRRQTASAPVAHRSPQATAPPASPYQSVTFESYLHDNASHPAIARRPANMASNQKAFVQPVVRATITGSTLDANGNPAAAPASAAAGGSLPANANPVEGTTSDVPSSGADASQGSPLR